jgi:hypothetical protein
LGVDLARAEPAPGLAVLVEEAEDVVEPEPSVAALANPIERELAAVAQPLHRVDVEMQHLRDFGGREHRSEFVDCHRGHCHRLPFDHLQHLPTRARPVLTGAVRLVADENVGVRGGRGKPYFGSAAGQYPRPRRIR